jgi:hypothetical protein
LFGGSKPGLGEGNFQRGIGGGSMHKRGGR